MQAPPSTGRDALGHLAVPWGANRTGVARRHSRFGQWTKAVGEPRVRDAHRKTQSGTKLFKCTYSKLASSITSVGQILGVKLVSCQMRHSSASIDCGEGRRTLDQIRKRELVRQTREFGRLSESWRPVSLAQIAYFDECQRRLARASASLVTLTQTNFLVMTGTNQAVPRAAKNSGAFVRYGLSTLVSNLCFSVQLRSDLLTRKTSAVPTMFIFLCQTRPRGLPEILPTRDREFMVEGNRMLDFVIDIITWCRAQQTPFCLRLPHGSLMWHDRGLRRIFQLENG